MIESTITESFPEANSGLVADLCNAGLREINYEEIAEHYISDRDLWSAGWNMPGYMPDSDPAIFTSDDAAREYIAGEMSRFADHYFETDPAAANDLETAAETCRKGKGEFGETIGQYHYWVTKV